MKNESDDRYARGVRNVDGDMKGEIAERQAGLF